MARRCLIFFVFLPFILQAQNSRIEAIMAIKPDIVGELGTSRLPSSMRLLSMDFAGAQFVNPTEFKGLKTDSIASIKLVYTRFRELEEFDQPELNRQRLQMLEKQIPGILSRNEIRWEVLEQRNAVTRENAARCFHGFVIVMKRNPSPRPESRMEIDIIERVLRSVHDTSIDIPLEIDYKIRKVRTPTGKYLPRNLKKRKSGFRYNKPGIWFREPEMKVRRDSVERGRKGGYTVQKRNFDASFLPDTFLLQTLNRLPSPDTKAVVQDVTASMSPYTAQMLVWLALRPGLLENGQYLFFNDGDNMPDEWKVPGKTGGIYPISSNQFDSVKAMAYRAMRNGSGGDMPENNIEALLRAAKEFPDADTLLMIADNTAGVKDMRLIVSLKKPVNVIPCNIQTNIHANLVDIAIKTGGLIYFPDGPVFNPSKAKDGTKIDIGRKTFEYSKKRFTLVHVRR